MSRGKWIIAFLCVPAALLGAAILRSGHICGRLQAEGAETKAVLTGCSSRVGFVGYRPHGRRYREKHAGLGRGEIFLAGGTDAFSSLAYAGFNVNELPFKFEAGTPDYIGTTGLAKALDYVSLVGMDKIAAYEHELTQYAMQRLKEIPGMRIFGEAEDKGSVISFLVGDIHHFDMGTLLDRLGIAVRTGHHCAQPLMQRLGIEGTVRASFGLYNTREEIDVLVAGIVRVSRMF